MTVTSRNEDPIRLIFPRLLISVNSQLWLELRRCLHDPVSVIYKEKIRVVIPDITNTCRKESSNHVRRSPGGSSSRAKCLYESRIRCDTISFINVQETSLRH
uniref:Uncharacterized protein n=1 Tax=Helianthus annuus TaxID=4232 RepID=A0A251V591_HELAN